MSPTSTRLNLAQRMDETDRRLALCARRLAALGWTDRELDALVEGADVRDILRGDCGTWLRGE